MRDVAVQFGQFCNMTLKMKICILKKKKVYYYNFPNKLHPCGAVVSTSDYEFTGPSSIPDENSQRTAHPTVHPPKWVG